MKITSKRELTFFLKADMMMNRGRFSNSFWQLVINFFKNDIIMDFLITLRKKSYYKNSGGYISKLLYAYYGYKNRELGLRLGYSIDDNVFGYGLVIPHYGTIVVGSGNVIGNYCVLHTATCITQGKKKIGNAFYLSTGAKIIHDIELIDGVSVAANSVVNSSCNRENIVLAGMPAKVIKESVPWYLRDGDEYKRRVNECEKLKEKMGLFFNYD